MPTRKKCFSKCRKKSESNCGPKICKYVKGNKYQYCRLGYKYKLDANCNITRRKIKRKMTKKNARLKINSFVNKTKRNKQTNIKYESKSESKIKAANQIQRFMNKNKYKIKSRFLQSICSDSGLCLAFGKKSKEIKTFFNDFVEFDNARSPLKRMGNPSENGFVNEVTYKREKYNAHTIIKSSAKNNSDNLFYEYLCGLLINKWNARFPCFLETYGLYSFNTNNDWTHVKENQTTTVSSFKNHTTLLSKNTMNLNSIDRLIGKSCVKSKHLSIMIQHIKDASSLDDFIYDQTDREYLFNNQLVTILFQVYFTLHVLKDQFTHYDLHTGNILIYTPNPYGCIHYHYVLSNGKTIDFKSPYMVKIIDYGRCYFKDENNPDYNSKYIHNEVCNEANCNPACGEEYGYSWLSKTGPLRSQFYIYSSISNHSHDLRALKLMKDNAKYYQIKKTKRNEKTMYSFLKKVKYNSEFGTQEVKGVGYPDKIANVTDAFKGLGELIVDTSFQERNTNDFDNYVKLGDLYVYENERSMRFSE